MKLAEMKKGDTGVVTGYEKGERTYRQKLLRMGLVKGCVFTVTRVAPLGDPVEISVDSHRLTLRKNEAQILEVERRS
jgi:ferrous iron transport protein A